MIGSIITLFLGEGFILEAASYKVHDIKEERGEKDE